MATITATITINPAFLQEFKEDNHELRQLLHHSTAMLSRPRGMRVESKRLAELLDKLRDQLALHFSLEESYGYFEEALHVSPRLAHQAESLRGQHGELYIELCNIVDEAQELLYSHHLHSRAIRRIADHFSAFRDKLQHHEADENALILEAFDEEIGAGD